MKIKKSRVLFFLLFLCCAGFFIPGDYIQGIYYLDVRIILILIWCVLGLLFIGFKISESMDENGVFCRPVLAFFGLIAVEIIYSYILYRQSVQSVFKIAYFYLILIVYFVLIYLINTKEKLEDFKYLLVLFCTLCNVFQICYVSLMHKSWNPYFYLMLCSFPITFSYVFNKRHIYLSCINLITTAICIFVISENTAVRIIFLAIAAASAIAKIVMKNRFNKGRAILLSFLVIILFVVFGGVFGDYVNTVINSEVGNKIRVYAIEYYWGQFKENLVLGMGLIDPTAGSKFYTLVHGGISPLGGTGQYYLEDVGVFGYIAQFGLVGVFVFGWIIKVFFKAIKQVKEIDFFQNLGLFTLFITMFVSLMPTNKAPIQIFPIILAIAAKNVQFSVTSSSDEISERE